MKTKGIWKKIVSHILTTVMLVSIFAGVDMGWNVMEVQAREPATHNSSTISSGMKFYPRDILIATGGSKDMEISIENYKAAYVSSTREYTFPDFPSDHQCYYQSNPGSVDSKQHFSFKMVNHNFNAQTGTSEFLRDEPDCTKNATYYYKCSVCGKKGTNYYSASNSALGHNFTYTGNENRITATCSREGCSYNTSGIILTLNASDKQYTGNSYDGASIGDWSVSESGLEVKPTTINYKNQDGTEAYDSTTAPTKVGSYTAAITVGGATAEKEFSITKADPVVGDFTYTAPSSLAYDGNAKSATVVAKEGKTNGTITVKYFDSTDTEVTSPTVAGEYKVKITVTEGDNYNAVTTPMQVGTFTIGQIDYPGTKTASADLVAKDGKSVEVTLPDLPDGASYGTASNSNTSYFTVGEVANGKVTVTSAKDWATTETADKTFTIPVTGATNYNGYNVTVTITPKFHSHTFSYSVSGNKIEATCGNADGECDLTSNPELVLTASDADYDASAAYAGASIDATWTESELEAEPTLADIVYKKVDSAGTTTGGEDVSADSLRATAGYYYASITVGGKTAVKAFVVNKLNGPDAPTDLDAEEPYYIGGDDGKITGVDETMEYSTDGGDTWTPVTGNEITGLSAGEVLVRVKETETNAAGSSTTVTIPDGTNKNPTPVPTGLVVTPISEVGAKDGKVSNVTEDMEYSLDNGATWIPVTGTEITGLAAGEIKIRLKETDTALAGESLTLTIDDHSHTLTLIPGKTPTETEDGWNDYYQCTGDNGCNKYFEDAAGLKEILDIEEWKLTAGHLSATVTHDKEKEEGNYGQSTIASGVTDDLTPEIATALSEGKNVNVWLQATDVSDSAPAEDKEKIVESMPESYQIGAIIDIQLLSQIEGEESSNITETKKPIQIRVGIPSEILKEGRKYMIMRVHDGVVDILPATKDGDDIIFSSHLFSTYSIIYSDTEEQGKEKEDKVRPHTHVYVWDNRTTVTKEEDGTKVLACTICGDVYATAYVSSYAYTCMIESEKVINAPKNASVVCEMGKWDSYPKWFFERLATRPDVNITLKFNYKHKKYLVYIPAGTAIDTTSCDWYGPLKLATLYAYEIEE